jgi:hypothetical protein
VFATEGDRRAGTHLLGPLELLYLTLFDHGHAEWQSAFESKSRVDDGGLVEVVSHFIHDVELGHTFLETYDASTEITNYLTLKNGKLRGIDNYAEVAELTVKQFVPSPHHPRALELLLGLPTERLLSLIHTILCKVGYEMGRIKRTLC